MASLQACQSRGHSFYRLVESFRKDGKPHLRILAHLGRAEDILHLVHGQSAPLTSEHFWEQMHAVPVDQSAAIEQEIVRQVIDIEPLQIQALAYDTTNFYTHTATTRQRPQLPQRGHNQQGRHDLRQARQRLRSLSAQPEQLTLVLDSGAFQPVAVCRASARRATSAI